MAALTGALLRCFSLVWLATRRSERLVLHPASAPKSGTLAISTSLINFLLTGCLVFLLATVQLARAKEAAPAADDPVLEARMMRIAAELRCLVCQNQTIADSSAGLAVDLRNQVREMLARGENDKQIIDYMTARYGDFVLYRPPLKTTTALLWFGPAAFLLGGVITLFFVLRRRSRMAPEMFDADEVDPEPEPDPRAAR